MLRREVGRSQEMGACRALRAGRQWAGSTGYTRAMVRRRTSAYGFPQYPQVPVYACGGMRESVTPWSSSPPYPIERLIVGARTRAGYSFWSGRSRVFCGGRVTSARAFPGSLIDGGRPDLYTSPPSEGRRREACPHVARRMVLTACPRTAGVRDARAISEEA
jgi:hypothetical protein